MRSIRTIVVIISITWFCAGCDRAEKSVKIIYQTEPVEINSSYANPEHQEMFKKAMNSANIPYEVIIGKDGKEYVQWVREDAKSVQKVKERVFGVAPPSGRSIAFEGEMNERFKSWLKDNNIDFTTTTHFGTEYVIWAEEDGPRVEGFSYFPSYYYDMHGRSSNNSLKSGTQLSGAP